MKRTNSLDMTNGPAYLFLCYPISWVLALGAQTINFIHCRKKLA